MGALSNMSLTGHGTAGESSVLSRAAARACLGKQPAFQARTSAGLFGGQPGSWGNPANSLPVHFPRTAKEARVSMGAPAVCERSCGYGCTQQHVLNRTRYSRRELRSRTSFLAHAELETGVAARKFRRCNEKSRAAARACLGKLPALQTRTSAGLFGGQPGSWGNPANSLPVHFPRTAKEARVSMGAPAVCERSCGYGCTQQHVLNRTRYSRRELRSRTSFPAHAELETGVAARKFRRCNEKSRAAARACLGKLPALQTRTSAGLFGGQPGSWGNPANSLPVHFPRTAKEARVSMGVHMYVCMCVFVCMYECMYIYMCMYVCMYVCIIHACMHVCMYICMYVCM
ncbi:hypothetical protein HOLleu_22604 [Holothuria leucospilota]|uniref:Uncharacterized protein n=1 Tax=Holothuria leucospilota TaxID=206669 RepID=A0A9Q1H7M4_HOLLE|nr:hypothetical protein HOLleu_22604 [Holothuria leucospilota]